MTPTATHRQRLEAIRERTHHARSRRADARQLLDAGQEEGDLDAQAVARIAYDQADEELQVAERLESQLLSSLAGVSTSVGVSMREDPQAQALLSEIAASNVPLTNFQKVGTFATAEELAATFNQGIQAAVTLPADPITSSSYRGNG